MQQPDRPPRRQMLLAGLAGLALPLAACGAAPLAPGQPIALDGPTDGPWRTRSQDGAEDVMLEGHDPVAYFQQREAVPGRQELALKRFGVTWLFATAASREAFDREPLRYAPQFGGFCSNGINYAIPWGGGGGPDSWRIYRGRLYVFGGRAARDHFEMDAELNLRRAHHHWNAEVAGRSALLTRMRRLVIRVPHYRSDASLQAEWEQRRQAGTLPVMPGRPQVVPAEA